MEGADEDCDILSEQERNILEDVWSLVENLKFQLNMKTLRIADAEKELKTEKERSLKEKIKFVEEIQQLKTELKR